MNNSKARILDHRSLGELNNAFEYAADSVLKVQRAVADYLRGVIEVMEQQLEIVEKKYEEAKERLEADSEIAQRNCYKWERNYETAKEVLSQCKAYKSDWEYQAPFFSGGDFHLEMLGKQHTDEATKKLKKIIDVADKYLAMTISSRGSSITEEVPVLDKYDRKKIISNSDVKVRNEQIHEIHRHDARGATRVAKCKRCGRPLSICICGNTRKNIELL